MKYVYHILNHDSEQYTLQVQVSCVDTSHSCVLNIPYPLSPSPDNASGVPTLNKSRFLEEVMLWFRGTLLTWEAQEALKDKYKALKGEAESLVGTSVSFDHTMLDDGWFAEDIE